jgi:hypothetical protein
MCVAAQKLEVQPQSEHSLNSEGEVGPPVGCQATAFPQTTIRLEERPVATHKLIEVGARDLFLALDDPTDGHRWFAVEGGDCRQPQRDLSLVVGGATGK